MKHTSLEKGMNKTISETDYCIINNYNNTTKVPCKQPQDCGWTCNEGHLCNECKTKLRIRIALNDQKQKIREWLKSDKVREIMSNEISDLGDTEQLINNLLKNFDELKT